MELQSILQTDYLDIIFANRNKSYGSYELRKHYNRRAIKAILLVFTVLSLAIGLHFIRSMFREKPIGSNHRVMERPYEPKILEYPKPEIDIPKHKPSAVPKAKPTVAVTPPKVVPDDDVVKDPPTIDDMKTKEIGTVDAKGSQNGIAPATTTIPGTGTLPNDIAPPAPTSKIEKYVDQMPEFDGNISEYLSSHIRYPEMAKETHIQGRVTIKFVVNEDGSISDAKVIRGIGGGCEEEALRVVSSMPKWKPGKLNGRPVKVYCTVPVSFVLQ